MKKAILLVLTIPAICLADVSLDKMLERVYASDMQTPAGRVRWHGSVVTNRVDTNALVKVQIHEDGFCYTQKFHIVTASTVTARLSAAERNARAKRLAEERRRARVDALETNLSALASDLAERKHYPLDLAVRILQAELNSLQNPTSVTTVVTPQ